MHLDSCLRSMSLLLSSASYPFKTVFSTITSCCGLTGGLSRKSNEGEDFADL